MYYQEVKFLNERTVSAMGLLKFLGDVLIDKLKFRNNSVDGYIPSNMDLYEEYEHTIKWAGGGMGSNAPDASVKLYRQNGKVTLCVGSMGATDSTGSAANISFATNLPARFRPSATVSIGGVRLTYGASGSEAVYEGVVNIGTDGSVTIEREVITASAETTENGNGDHTTTVTITRNLTTTGGAASSILAIAGFSVTYDVDVV